MEHVTARWMYSLHGFMFHGIEWIVFHGHLDYFSKPLLGDRPNTNPPGDYGTPNVPSSLHTTLEGPTEYVTARWMYSLHGFLFHGIEMDHVSWSLGLFSKPTSWR